jgi:nicotinate-nucleotide pyrophosphorylase (carboxylating)
VRELLELPLNKIFIERLIDQALEEDLGSGDITTFCVVGASGRRAAGNLVARQDGTLCGIGMFEGTIRRLDGTAEFNGELKDGDEFAAGRVIRRVEGDAGGLLSAERTALNFLQHLSGIATLTAEYVKAIDGTKAKIADTRKTLPGLRFLEKYAVRCGGGRSHRFNLSDMVLIKDNHIAYAGGIEDAVALVRRTASHALKIEVEVNTLDQVREALASQVDVIMLDNMSVEDIRSAVNMVGGKALLEASGNVTLENVREIAECGVDLISVGRITHSAAGVDISLDFEGT